MTEPIEAWKFAARRVEQYDAQALAHDRYRRRYPEAVFDLITDLDGIYTAGRVLEIGAGTGIATLPLVEGGPQVTVFEPAPVMAEIAQAKLGSKAVVVNSRFEDWSGPTELDAIVAFSSWRWVDPGVGVDMAARVLRRGGCLMACGPRSCPGARTPSTDAWPNRKSCGRSHG